MSLTNIFIVVQNIHIGEQIRDALHNTGLDLLVMEIIDRPETLASLVITWRPQVLVAQQGLSLEGISVPVVWFDCSAFNPQAVGKAVVQAAASAVAARPALQPHKPSQMPFVFSPNLVRGGIAVGLQGVKGGVGTTTVACAIAITARHQQRQVAILDFDYNGSDCAVTLHAREDQENPHLFMSDEGILVVRAPVDLNRVWATLADEYDVIVVDAGRVGECPEAVRALARMGVQWFLVCSPETLELLDPGRYPGFRILLNRERARRWWQWDVAGTLPNDELVTDQINRGAFNMAGAPSPFALGIQGFTSRLLLGEVV